MIMVMVKMVGAAVRGDSGDEGADCVCWPQGWLPLHPPSHSLLVSCKCSERGAALVVLHEFIGGRCRL